jgi:hypothetical protein
MLVELCVGNYATHGGLFNRVDKVFWYASKLCDSESLILIVFNNPKKSSTTRIWNQHLYTINIPKHWTPIQPIFKEIQVGVNSSHVITCIHLIQPIVVCTTYYWIYSSFFFPEVDDYSFLLL